MAPFTIPPCLPAARARHRVQLSSGVEAPPESRRSIDRAPLAELNPELHPESSSESSSSSVSSSLPWPRSASFVCIATYTSGSRDILGSVATSLSRGHANAMAPPSGLETIRSRQPLSLKDPRSSRLGPNPPSQTHRSASRGVDANARTR